MVCGRKKIMRLTESAHFIVGKTWQNPRIFAENSKKGEPFGILDC